jgi:hypothetical protein
MADGHKCQKTGFGILSPFIRSNLTGVIKFNWRQETEIIDAPIAKLVLPAEALLGKMVAGFAHRTPAAELVFCHCKKCRPDAGKILGKEDAR